MPQFDKQFYSDTVPENIELHSPLNVLIQATSPMSRKLIYSIVKGNELEEFAVDFNTGMQEFFSFPFFTILFVYRSTTIASPGLALPFLHFRHYVISFFSYPVNGRCCLNHFSSHSFVCLKMMAHNSPKRQEENSNNPTITLLPTIVPVQLNIVDAIFTSHSSFSTSWWFVTLIFLLADFFSLSIVWYFDMRQKRFHSRLPSL